MKNGHQGTRDLHPHPAYAGGKIVTSQLRRAHAWLLALMRMVLVHCSRAAHSLENRFGLGLNGLASQGLRRDGQNWVKIRVGSTGSVRSYRSMPLSELIRLSSVQLKLNRSSRFRSSPKVRFMADSGQVKIFNVSDLNQVQREFGPQKSLVDR